MNYGYARVSTRNQNLDLQLDALKKAGCERVFVDIASGAKTERTDLNRMLSEIRPKGLSREAEATACAAETLYKEQKLSVQQISIQLSISKATLYSYLRHRRAVIVNGLMSQLTTRVTQSPLGL